MKKLLQTLFATMFATMLAAALTLGTSAHGQVILKIAYETSDTHIKARSALVFKQELEKRAAQ